MAGGEIVKGVIGDRLEEGFAIHTGHVEVKEDDERFAAGAEEAQGGPTIRRFLDEVSFVEQEIRDAEANVRVIFDDEDDLAAAGTSYVLF